MPSRAATGWTPFTVSATGWMRSAGRGRFAGLLLVVAAFMLWYRADRPDILIADTGALVGVMVAVALLPPLMVVALLAGAGEWRGAWGALLLYSTNVASVNLAGIAVFLARGITPRSWWEKRRARRAAWWAMAFWVLALVVLVAGLILYNRA